LAVNRQEGEDKMLRGHELEPEAVALTEKELKKTFNKDLVIWGREDNESIALSPDAYLDDLTEAIEVKCLSSADHIKAIITKEWPEDYKFQVYQYFIVNDELETLHFVMYDPSFDEKLAYKRFEIKRDDVKLEVDKYLEYQKIKLMQINEIVNKLSF
jgi:hypothetical protein